MARRDDEERELDEIRERYDAGEITLEQYNKEVREITRWYRDAARDAADEAARDAYDREMERW